ncbi:MAG TPA: hypothetical protein VML95_12545 [Longimicrobiales bacterium]|nr:hypothetical protein [Longimicrobiales bacterium]
MKKRKDPSTLRRRAGETAAAGARRAGETASAGVRRAASAVRRARAWRGARKRETIPVSSIPPVPAPETRDSAGALESLEETVREHPVGALAAATFAGYVLGRLLD